MNNNIQNYFNKSKLDHLNYFLLIFIRFIIFNSSFYPNERKKLNTKIGWILIIHNFNQESLKISFLIKHQQSTIIILIKNDVSIIISLWIWSFYANKKLITFY